MKIGILDIQGSVEEHAEVLRRLGVEAVFVKKVADLEEVDGLIIPGGESTTILKLMKKSGLREAILAKTKKGMALWGTCAGAILMAKGWLGLMDITIERNAYGRQLESFEGEVEFVDKRILGIFIRAPKIVRVGKEVEILGHCGKEVVAAREGNLFVTTFHPELTSDDYMHKLFLEYV